MFYSIDVETEKLNDAFGGGFDEWVQAPDGKIILQNEVALTVIENNGSYWGTERISYDGIAKLRIDGNVVYGLAFTPTTENDDWTEFMLDLNNRKIVGGI